MDQRNSKATIATIDNAEESSAFERSRWDVWWDGRASGWRTSNNPGGASGLYFRDAGHWPGRRGPLDPAGAEPSSPAAHSRIGCGRWGLLVKHWGRPAWRTVVRGPILLRVPSKRPG